MKPCEKVPAEHLLAYHLNALAPLYRLPLSWHLKRCAHCRSSLLGEQALDSRLRHGASLTPSTPTPTPPRQLALRWGGAALALMGLIAGAVLLHPGAPGGPQIAFADVEQALSDSRYITWTQTYHQNFSYRQGKKKPFEAPLTLQSSYWVEVDSLKLAVEEKATGYRGLTDSTHFEGRNGMGQYTWTETRDHQPRTSIKQMVLSPLDPSYPDKIPAYSFKIDSTPWQKEAVRFQGKPAMHFSRSSTIKLDSGQFVQTQKEQIWVDPGTRHLLRRESESEYSGGYKTSQVAENFRYVDTAPAGAFDPVRPSPGEHYTFSNPTGPERKLSVENKSVDKAIRTQVNQIVSAMNAGNGLQLASLGDAELYASDGPDILNGKSRAQRAAYLKNYLKYVAQHRVLRNWKTDRLPGLFTSVLTHWHRHEEGAAYPPTGPMEVGVHLSGTATLASGKRQKVRSYAVFRLTPNGPKLTWFNPNNHK